MTEDSLASQVIQFRQTHGHLSHLTDGEIINRIAWADEAKAMTAAIAALPPMTRDEALRQAAAVRPDKPRSVMQLRNAASVVIMMLTKRINGLDPILSVVDTCALDLARYVLRSTDNDPSVIAADRYEQLMSDSTLQLNEQEIAAGWHFCPAFDGLLSQGEKGPRECFCGVFRDGTWSN